MTVMTITMTVTTMMLMTTMMGLRIYTLQRFKPQPTLDSFQT